MAETQEPSTSHVHHVTSEEQNMSDTFATVWVKVEVQDHDDDNSLQTVDVNPIDEQSTPKRKRKPPTKPLCCDKCDYKTVYKNCLKAHILGHLNERPYSCSLCPYSSIYSAALSRHIIIKHPGETGVAPPVFRCQVCEYKTNFKGNLKSHARKHQLEKNFKCVECNFETAYRHSFVKHERTHHAKEDKVFRCDKCPFVTKFDGHIKRHLAVIHNEISVGAKICDLCGFVTRLNWRLKIHKDRSRRKELMKCDRCDFETHFSCEYKKHVKTHTGDVYLNGKVINKGRNGKCESNETADGMMNVSIENMQRTGKDFEMTDLAENIYEGGENSEVDLEGVSQDKHGKKHHYVVDPECLDWHSIQVLESEDKEKPYQCLLCEYTSKFKAAVQRHFQRNHTSSKNRPYKCVNCDFSTKTKDQIALHDKRSKSSWPVHCKTCTFSTYYKCKLVMHRKSHYEFSCSECDYTCRHKYALAKHYNTYHLGVGFKCQYCEYTGTRKESLEAHVAALHTGNKPFKCLLCDYSAIRMCILEVHVKKHHSDMQALSTIDYTSHIESSNGENYVAS